MQDCRIAGRDCRIAGWREGNAELRSRRRGWSRFWHGLVPALLCVLLAGTISCSSGSAPHDDEAHDEAGHDHAAHASSGDAPVVRLLREPTEIAPFTVTDLSGRAINSADLRGKVVIVNFWATWCPPCRAEIPDLIKLQDKYRDQLVVLGISEDEGPLEEVKAFVAEQKMTYPVAMTTPELRKIFRGVTALPTTFVLDRDGKIAQKHVGMLNAERTELETQVLAGMKVNARVEHVDDVDRARLENAAQATEIPGVDLTGLTPAKRTEAIKAMNAEDCTCGCGLTLAECRINDPECPVSLPLAQELARKFN